MVEKKCIAFFKELVPCIPGQKLLVAFSGGGDSMTLLHLLVKYREVFQFEVIAAHMNHGWRVESDYEAAAAGWICEELGVPFFRKDLRMKAQGGNLEARAREARIKFFQEIYHSEGASALVLGHHADDLAETVLKRVFEGAKLQKLYGMKPVGELMGMQVYRPLLRSYKEELLTWLQDQRLSFFEDRTNIDTQFLRGRLRVELFPFLEKNFGKKIRGALCEMSERSSELSDYLWSRIAPIWEKRVCDNGMILLDLRGFSLHLIEAAEVVGLLGAELGIAFSKEEIKRVARAIVEKEPHIKIVRERVILVASMGKVYIKSISTVPVEI